jgi:hypothetical protein
VGSIPNHPARTDKIADIRMPTALLVSRGTICSTTAIALPQLIKLRITQCNKYAGYSTRTYPKQQAVVDVDRVVIRSRQQN